VSDLCPTIRPTAVRPRPTPIRPQMSDLCPTTRPTASDLRGDLPPLYPPGGGRTVVRPPPFQFSSEVVRGIVPPMSQFRPRRLRCNFYDRSVAYDRHRHYRPRP
jgi:hypothetical protein